MSEDDVLFGYRLRVLECAGRTSVSEAFQGHDAERDARHNLRYATALRVVTDSSMGALCVQVVKRAHRPLLMRARDGSGVG